MRNPYENIPGGVDLNLSSEDFTNGQPLPIEVTAASSGGKDLSPQLSWQKAPTGTQSLMVTCYDPDAPTPSGYWHWVVVNLPADVTSLAKDAARNPLPGTLTLLNDNGDASYLGAAPPKGHGPHRYFFAVLALDKKLDIPANTTPAVANFLAFGHTLGRGVIYGTWEN